MIGTGKVSVGDAARMTAVLEASIRTDATMVIDREHGNFLEEMKKIESDNRPITS